MTTTAWMPLAKAMTERDLQASVVKLAAARGWRVFADNDSRRNQAGWLDLTMVRRGRLVIRELKTETGRIRPEQWEWLREWEMVPCAEVGVWRPRDWFSGAIAAVLA